MSEPEVVWCSGCGKKIWVELPTYEEFIECEKCRKVKR